MAGLDRLITLYVSDEGAREKHGEYIDGPVHTYRVWASVDDAFADVTFSPGYLALSDERAPTASAGGATWPTGRSP